ncbi:hypothetical protein, partial [Thiolapillus sp.]|uniref:hypothetical protein n=1 Tax=Thiolapillus sp. TaxID=2017437 RepID=UPI003AF540AD
IYGSNLVSVIRVIEPCKTGGDHIWRLGCPKIYHEVATRLSNETEEGRKKNRRVVLEKISNYLHLGDRLFV